MSTELQFFFDPMCPYAYQAAVWIRRVRDEADLDIQWRFFSLEEINRVEGKKHPWEREWSFGWSQMRIGAYLRRMGQDVVDEWYEAVGRAFHEDAVPTHVPDVHAALLNDLGHDGHAVIEAATADQSTSDDVRHDHDWVVTQKGAHGVPTLVFPNGHALYGPVIVPAPEGEEAQRLWELVAGWAEFPYLFELRQPKTPEHIEHIATAFEPYLRARSWKTIENPAP